MAQFDFVSDPDLRASLLSDYRELNACLETGSWKAAHVLAGSIIEAILVDYVAGLPNPPSNLLSMMLGPLLDYCKEHQILSTKYVEIGTAVKNFRNCIHPGRVIRLGEVIDKEGATVAAALAEMILKEVAKRKKETYGFTADELVAKILADPSTVGIFPHLIKSVNIRELRRLIVERIPLLPGWIDKTNGFTDSEAARLTVCFHYAYEAADSFTKKEVVEKYLEVLRTGTGPLVQLYEECFFRTPQLDLMDDEEKHITKKHLLISFADDPARFVGSMAGIGRYLGGDDAQLFAGLTFNLCSGESFRGNSQHRFIEELRNASPHFVRAVRAGVDSLGGEVRNQFDATRVQAVKQRVNTLLELASAD